MVLVHSKRLQTNNEERDYIDYLLSMEQAVSIDQLIKIYNDVYTMLAVIIFGSYQLPMHWYKIASISTDNAVPFLNLNHFLNEHILRLFKKIDNPSKEQCSLFLANLRQCVNSSSIDRKIMNRVSLEDTKDLKELIEKKVCQHSQRLMLEKQGCYTKRHFAALMKLHAML